jgi:hypothetical protein
MCKIWTVQVILLGALSETLASRFFPAAFGFSAKL